MPQPAVAHLIEAQGQLGRWRLEATRSPGSDGPQRLAVLAQMSALVQAGVRAQGLSPMHQQTLGQLAAAIDVAGHPAMLSALSSQPSAVSLSSAASGEANAAGPESMAQRLVRLRGEAQAQKKEAAAAPEKLELERSVKMAQEFASRARDAAGHQEHIEKQAESHAAEVQKSTFDTRRKARAPIAQTLSAPAAIAQQIARQAREQASARGHTVTQVDLSPLPESAQGLPPKKKA